MANTKKRRPTTTEKIEVLCRIYRAAVCSGDEELRRTSAAELATYGVRVADLVDAPEKTGRSMTPQEIDLLADAIVKRLEQSPDELIDVHAKAKQLNCSVATVERMARSGELESIKIARLRRYPRSALPNKKGGNDE